MKLLILIVLLSIQSLMLHAQDAGITNSTSTNKIYKYELGLSFMGIQAINSRNSFASDKPQIQLVNGIMFKKHYAANVFRFGLGYSEDNSNYTLGSPTGGFYEHQVYNAKSIEFKTGYERNIKFNHLTLYGSIDMVYILKKYKESVVWGGGDFPPYFGSGTVNGTSNYLGFSPGIGLRYRFSKCFSASIESNLTFIRDVKSPSDYYFYYYPVKFLQFNYHW